MAGYSEVKLSDDGRIVELKYDEHVDRHSDLAVQGMEDVESAPAAQRDSDVVVDADHELAVQTLPADDPMFLHRLDEADKDEALARLAAAREAEAEEEPVKESVVTVEQAQTEQDEAQADSKSDDD